MCKAYIEKMGLMSLDYNLGLCHKKTNSSYYTSSLTVIKNILIFPLNSPPHACMHSTVQMSNIDKTIVCYQGNDFCYDHCFPPFNYMINYNCLSNSGGSFDHQILMFIFMVNFIHCHKILTTNKVKSSFVT